jgi:sugar O-acyltransferase (sialic acid O-acetyltransferase NeuD family)
MNKTHKLIIFGNGEIARLAATYFSEDSKYKVYGFVIDDEFYKEGMVIDGYSVYSLKNIKNKFPISEFEFHVALGFRSLNTIRENKYNLIKSLGYTMASYVSSKSVFWSDLKHGDNCLILENQTIQPTVEIGNNVMIWSGNHLGHRCIIRDHVYISSHTCIAGYCDIGERSFVGINSTIKDQTKILSDCFIGMGAIVHKNLKVGDVVLAPRSEIIDRNDRRNKIILKTFMK